MLAIVLRIIILIQWNRLEKMNGGKQLTKASDNWCTWCWPTQQVAGI